jgi:hypothetical protein
MSRLVWLLAFAAWPAHADPVYRCGPDGSTYSQWACEGGVALDVADPRDNTERAEAQAAADSEARLADRLRRERRARDAAAMKERAAGFDTAPRPAWASPAPVRAGTKAKAKGPRRKKASARPSAAGT